MSRSFWRSTTSLSFPLLGEECSACSVENSPLWESFPFLHFLLTPWKKQWDQTARSEAAEKCTWGYLKNKCKGHSSLLCLEEKENQQQEGVERCCGIGGQLSVSKDHLQGCLSWAQSAEAAVKTTLALPTASWLWPSLPHAQVPLPLLTRKWTTGSVAQSIQTSCSSTGQHPKHSPGFEASPGCCTMAAGVNSPSDCMSSAHTHDSCVQTPLEKKIQEKIKTDTQLCRESVTYWAWEAFWPSLSMYTWTNSSGLLWHYGSA